MMALSHISGDSKSKVTKRKSTRTKKITRTVHHSVKKKNKGKNRHTRGAPKTGAGSMKSFLQEGEEGDDYGHVSDYLTKAALQLQDTDKEGAERGGDSNVDSNEDHEEIPVAAGSALAGLRSQYDSNEDQAPQDHTS